MSIARVLVYSFVVIPFLVTILAVFFFLSLRVLTGDALGQLGWSILAFLAALGLVMYSRIFLDKLKNVSYL